MAQQKICECEDHTHGPRSPGVVRSDECVIRFVTADDLEDDGTTFSPAFISGDELKRSNGKDGVSAVRSMHLDDESFETASKGGVNRKKEFVGAAKVLVQRLRECKNGEGAQALCVIDDPVEGVDAHALFYISAPTAGPGYKKIRHEISKFFEYRAGFDDRVFIFGMSR